MKIEKWQLQQRQSLPLELKVRMTQQRIKEWYDYWDGVVYVAFSGGKDSTVLLHLVREIYPAVPAVFVATGLQYPEIREFVKTVENVTWIKPKMPFTQVIKEYGYPVVSKMQARFIRDLQNASEKNKNVCCLRLTGYNQVGKYCPSMKLSDKWMFLVKAPFRISEQCCDIMKKEPFRRYVKETGRKPFTAVMADDSSRREQNYLRHGCMLFDTKEPICHPMSFWMQNDVLAYLKENNLKYASVYGDIVGANGKLHTTGVKRTGCVFCAFGAHLEKEPNRFQRLAKTHPQLYDYCMNNLGMAEVLDCVGVAWKPSQQLVMSF